MTKSPIAAWIGGAALAMAAAGQASAMIVNVSATAPTGTTIILAAGEYEFQWIGTADGGLYDGANLTCGGGCDSGWSEAIVELDQDSFDALIHHTNGDYNLYAVTPPGTTFSSAGAALDAYNSQIVSRFNYQIVGGAFTANLGPDGVVTSTTPFRFHTDGVTAHVFVADPDRNFDNNFGGISVRITSVPEPATWGLAIAGLAMTGAMLRRRRRAATA